MKDTSEMHPKSVAFCLRRICNLDEKLERDSAKYQNYFSARDYNPGEKTIFRH